MKYSLALLLAAGTALPAGAAPAPKRAPAAKPAVRKADPGRAVVRLQLLPATLTLANKRDIRRVLVTGITKSGGTVDLTGSAVFRPVGGLVQAAPGGYLVPQKVGKGSVTIRAAGKTIALPLTVKSMAAPPISFVRDVSPVLAKTGCNQGTCHGAQAGKNGFKLSLRGYDLEFDYQALVDDVSGRRFNRAAPDSSLMLQKPVQDVPHQGGLVFDRGSRYYHVIRQWIAEGVQSDVEKVSRVARLEVLPKHPTIPLPGQKQNLVVIAHYDDGTTRDVTRDARYTSSVPEVATVDDHGRVTTVRRGETAVQVSYEGQFATNEFTVLGDRTGWKWVAAPQQNFVDELVDLKLKRIKALPAPYCSDADFLRRVTLDLTGTLPTPQQTRQFLSECAEELRAVSVAKAQGGREQGAGGSRLQSEHGLAERKGARAQGPGEQTARLTAATSEPMGSNYAIRNTHYTAPVRGSNSRQTIAVKARARLIDRLLRSPEFDDHWTYKFADLLQVNRKYLGDKGMHAFRAWIHASIAQNRPLDQFVRELLTSTGSAFENPASNYFRVIRDTSTATENVTQLFLGVRFSCNKCHDHPFERWTQAQYYQLGAYFAQVGFKPGPSGDESIYDRNTGEVTHPRKGTVVAPEFPVTVAALQGGATPATRRQALAQWLTAAQNPFFAKSWSNRIWSYFLGRGIIDPVDDIRNSNPPSNAPLLDALTADFIRSGFDLRHLMRTIVSSRTYQASIAANRWNEDDQINFSHQVARRLTAEQLMDAISHATGSYPKYPGVPSGTRAQQLPDTRVANTNFLDLFGRPSRESPCECERSSEVSLAQALNLMNGDTIATAIADPNGRVARLVKEVPENRKLVEEIYLAVFCRLPTAKELDTAVKHIQTAKDRSEGAQDLMWALINSPAFLFNR